MAMITIYVLWGLAITAIAYTAWMVYYFTTESRRMKKNKESKPTASKRKGDIIGKSQFILPELGHSQPEASVAAESESDTEKENIFVPSNVPEYPRQVSSDELDEVFGSIPEGEKNEPIGIEVPLSYNNNFPNNGEAEETENFEEETEDIPTKGVHSALGVSFEQMGEAYRQVVHNPSMTEKEQEESGRVFLEMRETDMFEAIVSAESERENKVNFLMETYLTAFHQKIAVRSTEDNLPKSDIPSDFDLREYV
ncbi:hypothetical protein [Bacteroides sp. 224]|uniref:hypothetical protein n=1 Tax=Bacteroides sp. 224 TaxID=2302936 RepID=UPI0013D26740|nr:hypothetical protein [Bacteroides sp. 224]NDV64675.1 hypothetical protein [Bacteroides sp. 224]